MSNTLEGENQRHDPINTYNTRGKLAKPKHKKGKRGGQSEAEDEARRFETEDGDFTKNSAAALLHT